MYENLTRKDGKEMGIKHHQVPEDIKTEVDSLMEIPRHS